MKDTGVTLQEVANQVGHLKRSWSSNLVTADHVGLTSFPGEELRKDLRKWIAPPDPSVNLHTASDAHHEGTATWCIKGITVANWRKSGSLLWIHGKRTYPTFVAVLNCHSRVTPGLIAGSGKSILRCVTKSQHVAFLLNLPNQQVL